jgi:hypothetical protein
MTRRSAAVAALLIWSATSFAQIGGAPNHTNGNTTRTQSIQVGEPNTTHPGGNPGRTTGKTGNQSPFGNSNNAPAAGTQPASPSACPAGPSAPQAGSLSLNAGPSTPTFILNYPVVYNAGALAIIGNIMIAQDAGLVVAGLCESANQAHGQRDDRLYGGRSGAASHWGQYCRVRLCVGLHSRPRKGRGQHDRLFPLHVPLELAWNPAVVRCGGRRGADA